MMLHLEQGFHFKRQFLIKKTPIFYGVKALAFKERGKSACFMPDASMWVACVRLFITQKIERGQYLTNLNN